QGNPHLFEIRTRRRYLAGWDVNAYRPYLNAGELADAIRARRPDWRQNPTLSRMVEHLEDTGTLKPARMAANYYAPAFAAIEGALDELPAFGDAALVKELLATATFRSAEGTVWKSGGDLETYAASTKTGFSIVPRNYQGGL